jgi:oligoendopeptidase F
VDWDLSDVLESLDEEHTAPLFEKLEDHVASIEQRRDELDELSREDVAEVLDELAALHETAKRLYYRGSLAFAQDTTDDEARTFMERARQAGTEARNRTRFFTHWLKGLDDDEAKQVTPEDPELAYYVRDLRRGREYRLPEEIEEIIADKDDAGVGALKQAREILESSLTFEDPQTGEEVSRSQVKRRIYDADPEIRRAAYDELYEQYGEHESLLSHLYRNIVRDWTTENNKHRGYPRPETPRNLANAVRDEVVDEMIDVCVERRDLWQDFFAWKADEVGDPFDRRDIYAPVEEDMLDIPFDQARELVLDVHEGFHGEFAQATRQVFAAEHVDAFPAETKRGGAFCATPQTEMTPYVLLNHTDDARSVSTMAHELGHAVHSALASDRHPLVSSAPLPLAETASVFSELLLHHHLVDENPEVADALTAYRVVDLYATIQRQAYFARFERRAHELVAEGAPTRQLDEAYRELLDEQFGDLEVPDFFAKEWLMIPHFNSSPFYVSSYSFGALLSLSLYQRYQQDPSFAEDVIDILRAGGSRDPEELLAEKDLDITSAEFWHRGMDVVEEMVGRLN